MTSAEKAIYRGKSTVGVHSDFGGIEIKDILYGINDYVVCVSGTMCDNEKLHIVHERKIYYGNRPYFRLYNRRIYLDECMRVG